MAQGSVYFRYFSIVFPWKREGTPLRLNNRDTLCFTLNLVGICPVVMKKIFKSRRCFFILSSDIISPLKWVWSFIWTNLNFRHPRILCSKFCSTLLNSSQEEGLDLHLNRLESHSSKDALCWVYLKLAPWFSTRRCKCEMFTYRWTDRQPATREARLSLQLRWAKT